MRRPHPQAIPVQLELFPDTPMPLSTALPEQPTPADHWLDAVDPLDPQQPWPPVESE
jgi:hypothetical protein